MLAPGRGGRCRQHVDDDKVQQRGHSKGKGRGAAGRVQGKGKKQQNAKGGAGKVGKGGMPKGGKVLDEKRARSDGNKGSKQGGKKSKRR